MADVLAPERAGNFFFNFLLIEYLRRHIVYLELVIGHFSGILENIFVSIIRIFPIVWILPIPIRSFRSRDR